MQLEPTVDLPPELAARFADVAARVAGLDALLPAAVAASASRVLVISDFVLRALLRYPGELVSRLGDSDPLSCASVRACLDLAGRSETEAMEALRRLRHVEMARIAWRDLAGMATLEESLRDLSALADGLIELAVGFAACELMRSEPPTDAAGQPAPLLVLAMGKLGGRELNFSSDVDLVFLYPDDTRVEQGGRDEIAAYYRRLGQHLIHLLDQRTADGFVLRVDMRLRPFGKSGPIAISLAAFESYLLEHGRDWERYAYLKARLVTGHQYEWAVFDQILTPYVYRKYLDFGVFDALRNMKRLISRDVARKDMADNVKLGRGGIREVEFIVQAFQLVRGGRDRSLRTTSLLTALPRLKSERALETDTVETLADEYAFLRILENRLQALDDRQTHALPEEDGLRARLAYALDSADWPTLAARIEICRSRVESEFELVAWDTEEAPDRTAEQTMRAAWESGNIDDLLQDTVLAGNARIVRLLTGVRDGSLYERMDETSRRRLAAVLVRTLPLLAHETDPAGTLTRALTVFQAICRRSAYLSLLQENPNALERLLSLASRSAVLVEQVAEYPLLLDELLDPRIFEDPPTRAELEDMLQRQLKQAAAGDEERLLDAIRQFQNAATFRVAIADRLGRLPLMRVSDRLTDIAELVLDISLRTAWRELTAKHGKPLYGDPPEVFEAGFGVIGYGKLGGLELGYDSDLDLVFLHDSSGSLQETDGERALDNTRFFTRLVQRLIHYLTIQTSSGRLYDVDTRLRPGGGAGLVVASLANFHRYQRGGAWVWEHQALLRSRFLTGSDAIRSAFEQERRDVLVNHVARDRVKSEVATMRARMRAQLARGGPDGFDLKQDPGGLTDIEFLVDYWILSNSNRYPELVEFPDNMRQLDRLAEANLIPSGQRDHLQAAYLALRQRIHERTLAGQGRVVGNNEFSDSRKYVMALWQTVF